MRNFNRFSLKYILRSQRALATVEFALCLPLLLTLFFGVVELTRYMLIKQRIERVSYAINNMVGQYLPAQDPAVSKDEISVDNLNNEVFPQLSRMMAPYNDPSDLSMIITSVVTGDYDKTSSGNFYSTLKWQIGGGGSFVAANTVSVVNGVKPDAVETVADTQVYFNSEVAGDLLTAPPDENFITIEVFYHYQPLVRNILIKFRLPSIAQQTLIARAYSIPRQGALLALPPTFPVN